MKKQFGHYVKHLFRHAELGSASLKGPESSSGRRTCFGRSMIEMLGVLAIIGVLSHGGIMGYRLAINKYQAGAILEDVNRFAFTIIERAGLPEGDISKGDFVPSSSFEILGTNDPNMQSFYIDVMSIPKGVCEELLNKKTNEFEIYAGTHLYQGDDDICSETNLMTFVFGNTDGLCELLPERDEDECAHGCACTGACLTDTETGDKACCKNATDYTVFEGKCLKICSDNNDCADTEFCAFLRASDCRKGTGTCFPTNHYGTGTVKIINNQKWVRSSSGMPWESAKNWCKRYKRLDGFTNMELVSVTDIGCSYFLTNDTDGYCNDSNTLGKEGEILAILQTAGWKDSNYNWLNNVHPSNACYAYDVRFNTGIIGRHNQANRYLALCH